MIFRNSCDQSLKVKLKIFLILAFLKILFAGRFVLVRNSWVWIACKLLILKAGLLWLINKVHGGPLVASHHLALDHLHNKLTVTPKALNQG